MPCKHVEGFQARRSAVERAGSEVLFAMAAAHRDFHLPNSSMLVFHMFSMSFSFPSITNCLSADSQMSKMSSYSGIIAKKIRSSGEWSTAG